MDSWRREDDSDVESILSISASSSSRGYTLPPRDSSVHESPLAEVPELHLLELEEQVANYEQLTRQMAAEKGATLPDFPEDGLPLDRAERLKARFERVANLHESLEATVAPNLALPPPPRDAIVAARRAAAPLLLAAALNRATRSAPKRRGFHALLAAALAKRAPALPAPPPDTTAVDAAVEAARAEDRAALAAYCQAWGRWVEAETRLQETPVMLRTPSGYVQPSPWLAVANKNLELMQKYMAELGMTPASRSRVTVQDRLRPKPWEMFAEADDDDATREFFS